MVGAGRFLSMKLFNVQIKMDVCKLRSRMREGDTTLLISSPSIQ